jgi:hypothetical protein
MHVTQDMVATTLKKTTILEKASIKVQFMLLDDRLNSLKVKEYF